MKKVKNAKATGKDAAKPRYKHTKATVIESIVKRAGINAVQARAAIDTIIGAVSGLKRGERLRITGLGVFTVKARKGWTGRNPQNGEPVKVQPRSVLRFRPTKTSA